MTKKIDMVVDLQYGSTGKGLIAGYLANRHYYDVVVNANMPNAGHTFIDSKGHKMVHKVLPNGIANPECEWALLGPGSVFSLERLIYELDQAESFGYKRFKVGIHPNAVMLEDHHAEQEKALSNIGSTMQGSSAAMIQKIQRGLDRANIIGHLYDVGYMYRSRIMVLDHDDYRQIVSGAFKILAEGAQGFSLGINQDFYPYCTSRECTPSRFLSEMGLPINMLHKIVGTARTYPIRVGNTADGHSGGWYNDQEETSWEDLGLNPEKTTVTGRVRRVFTWSNKQIADAIWECCPDEIFLNFCNYASPALMSSIRASIGSLIRYEGYGPNITDVVDIHHG